MKLLLWGVEIPVTDSAAEQLLRVYYGRNRSLADLSWGRLMSGERVILGSPVHADGPFLVGKEQPNGDPT